MSKSVYRFFFIIFLILFLLFPFGVMGIPFLKTYMVFVILSVLVMFTFIKVHPLKNFESIWLLFLLYMPFTLVICVDYSSAIKAIFGILMLIVFYFWLRYVITKLGPFHLNNLLIVTGKWFLILSLLFYFLGIYFYQQGIDQLSFYSFGQPNRLLGSIFNRWTGTPRLAGFSQGPYSFNWVNSLFCLVFLKNNKTKWAILGIITGILTLSISFLAVIVVALTYIIVKKGYFLKFVVLLSLLFAVFFTVYNNNSTIKYVVDSRIENAKTGTGRLDIWYYVLEKSLTKPIFGHGINQLKYHLSDYPDQSIRSAHNTPLEVFFNFGIVGLIIYLIFLLGFFLKCIQLDKELNTVFFKGLFLCFFIFSFINNSVYIFEGLIFMLIVFMYSKNQADLKNSITANKISF